jgi:NAD(P)-dependent dehydrogenase (short-subunit alcohol dehydrogenase family)
MEIRGAVALVTGGAGGIGGAIAERLRADGATVVTTDLPGRGADLDVDVTDGDAVAAAVATASGRHGRLDLVVATAGMGAAGVVEELDEAAWRTTLDVNLWGTVTTVRAAYPTFVAQGRGHIVLVASLSGLVPTPLLVPYATAKAGVVGLATSLRPEAARHGVGVSAVCPGPVETPMLDHGGAGGVIRRVDVRRFLTSAAGPALPPATVATAVVDAVRHDRAVVAPGRAKLLWGAARLSPRLAEWAITRVMRDELRRAAA